MAENITQIKEFLHGLKESAKDYLVHIFGEEETIKFFVIHPENPEDVDCTILYNHGKNFIEAFPMLFSVPFKAVILNITVYKNHGFSNNYEFCKVIREKLRFMKVPHYFICSYQLLHLSLFTIANISAKIGDKFLIFNLNPNNAFSHCKFEFTQNGFIKNSIGQVRVEKETPFSPTTINGIEANQYSKIIICNINIHCQINERLRNVLDSAGNLIVVENEHYKRTCNRFICEMAKWMMDKSAVKFHVCPYSAWKYIVSGMIGDVKHDLIKAEIGENLPFEKIIIVDKTFHSYSALSIGENGPEVLESCKILDKECHKIEITFKIDDEHFHTLTTKNIIIPEIQNLPKTLDEINDKPKIPVVIGFWDNSSVICASKNGGKYKFLQNWNDMHPNGTPLQRQGYPPGFVPAQQQQQQQPYAYPLYLTANGQQFQQPTYASTNLQQHVNYPSQYPPSQQSNGTPLQSHGYPQDPAHFQQSTYVSSSNYPQNGNQLASQYASGPQQQLPQGQLPPRRLKYPSSSSLQQNVLPPNGAPSQSQRGLPRRRGQQQQPPHQGQLPSRQPTQPSSSSLPQNVLSSASQQQQPQQQDPSQTEEPQAKKKRVEKPKPQIPDDKLKDPSIAATAEYLKEYATTVSTVVRNYISHMSPSYIVEPRPISFGEQTFTQENIYEIITKIESAKNKQTHVCFAYIKKSDIECFVQVSFDKKGDITRDSVRFVIQIRYGEIQRITVFGYREIANAWKSFEINGEYKSEYLYCRKVTKTANEILEKLQSQHYPEKQFQIIIGVLTNIVKVQKLPCRTCGLLVKDKHVGELPTVFFGIFSSNVTVSHPSCISKENIL